MNSTIMKRVGVSLIAFAAGNTTTSSSTVLQVSSTTQLTNGLDSSAHSDPSTLSQNGRINNLNGSTSTGVIATTNAHNKDNKSKMDQYNKNVDQAIEVLKKSHIVCFDVDSTVIQDEGIDELAKFCGKGPEVERLTKEAMGGSMTFQEALRRRLNIIRPTQGQIREFLKLNPSILTSGIKNLINKLKSENKEVYLITGGFDCLINPVAEQVGIPLENVFANKLFFTYNGEYAGFDTNQPTSHSGGKGEAVSIIRRKSQRDVKITMVGDGATDMEAVAPNQADYFIGFGGNVVRDSVQKNAQYYATNFHSLVW